MDVALVVTPEPPLPEAALPGCTIALRMLPGRRIGAEEAAGTSMWPPQRVAYSGGGK